VLTRIEFLCRPLGGNLTVDQPKPYYVQNWVDSQTRFAPGFHGNVIIAVKRSWVGGGWSGR
jgi:hypothetical protein